MDDPGGSAPGDSDRVPHLRSDSDDNNEAGGNVAGFRRLRKRHKKRSYRRNASDDDEEEPNAGASNANDNVEPGGSRSMVGTMRWVVRSRKPRRSEPRLDSSDRSNSDSTDNNVEGDADERSDEWTTVSEDEPEFTSGLTKLKPKWTFFAMQESMRRQIGQAGNFERRFYGSVHTVECLQIRGFLDGHEGCVNTVEFNENGQLLASGSDDLAICVWNWTTKKKLNSYNSGHRNNVFQASWLPCDDSTMITCASDGEVRHLDLVRGTTRKLACHQGACNKFATHADTPHVAMSVGDDGKILSIDVRETEPTKLATIKKGAFTTLLYTIHSNPRKSHEFCVGGHSESIKIFDRRKTRKPICKFCPIKLNDNDRVSVTALTYNHDGTELLASYNDDDIYLFDAVVPHPTGDYAHKYRGHRNNRTIKGVNYFGPNSEFIVSGSDCGNVFFWEKNTEYIVQCALGDIQGVVNCVKPHPTIPVLASSGLDKDVKIWMPSAHRPPSLTELKSRITENLENRSEQRPFGNIRPGNSLICFVLERLWQNHELFSPDSESSSDGIAGDNEANTEPREGEPSIWGLNEGDGDVEDDDDD